MKDQYIPLNQADKIIVLVISSFISISYFLWILRNAVRVQHPAIVGIFIVLSLIVAWFGVQQLHFSRVHMKKREYMPFISLAFCLILSGLFLFEPILTHPYAAFGIPNRDTHDGITAFISMHGYPPQSYSTPENRFIPESVHSAFFGYPNALHSTASVLNSLGVLPFHSIWIVIIAGLLVTSLSIFLILKTMTNNPYVASVASGLFAVSSFKIPFAAITSVVMLYSYTLIIPILLLCLIVIFNKKNTWGYVLPALGVSLLAVSYYLTIMILVGLLVTFAILMWIVHDHKRLQSLWRLCVFCLPFLACTLLFQDPSYWQFILTPESLGALYDPNDPSVNLLPVDTPLYMMFYCLSMIVVGVHLIKKKWKTDIRECITLYLFVINIGLLLLIPYRLLYVQSGLLGSIRYEQAARLMLLQPFFFIFFLAEFVRLVKRTYVHLVVPALVIALCFFIRVDVPIYAWIPSVMQASFYNRADQNKRFTLISDLRLFVDDRMWSYDLLDALRYLKAQPLLDNTILVWQDVDPFLSERAIARWGSVYVMHKILRRTDVNTLTERIDDELLAFYKDSGIRYLLMIDPSDYTMAQLGSSPSVRMVWNQGSVYIYSFRFT